MILSKKHGFFIGMCLFPFVLFSQVQPDSTKKYGIEFALGANLSTMDRFGPYQGWAEKQYYQKGFLAGASVGLHFTYKLYSFLSLKLGVQNASYGGIFSYHEPTGQKVPQFVGDDRYIDGVLYRDNIYRLRYVEVPLVARFHLFSKRKVSPFAEIGFSYARLTKAFFALNYPIAYMFSPDRQNYTQDISSIAQKNAWNYLLGAGVHFFPNNRITCAISVRVSNSITRVFAYDRIDVYDEQTNKLINVYDMVTHLHSLQFYVGGGYNF